LKRDCFDVAAGYPEMTNYTAMRAYDAAIAYYKDIARGQQPKEPKISGLDALAYKAVYDACESRLGKPIANSPGSEPLTAENLVSCLRRLSKSVDFWTKQSGRRGYLEFVGKFV
jgi:hypothetical protein